MAMIYKAIKDFVIMYCQDWFEYVYEKKSVIQIRGKYYVWAM